MTAAAETGLWPLGGILPGLAAAAEPDAAEDEDDREAEAVALGEKWQEELDAAVTAWTERVAPEQFAEATELIEDAVKADDIEALAALAVPVMGGNLLLDHMHTMFDAGADFVVAEGADQGVKLKPAVLDVYTGGMVWNAASGVGQMLAQWALAVAMRIGARTSAGLSTEALRLYRPGTTAAQVVDGVQLYWDTLTDAVPREAIGAALNRATNLGKLETYAAAKPRGWRLELRADERLDKNTCGPCRKIDGEVLPDQDAAALAYGGAGYLYCEGRERCRGTVRGVWISKSRSDFDLDTLLNDMRGLR